MSNLHFAIIIFAFIILLLLNILFVYIPVYRIRVALEDIDNTVTQAEAVIEPIITRIAPLFESLF